MARAVAAVAAVAAARAVAARAAAVTRAAVAAAAVAARAAASREAARRRQAPAEPVLLSSNAGNRGLALAALGALALIAVALAALFAASGSNVVLATAGGSPGWLLGPLRFAGLPGADGPLAGPLFYLGLWLMLGAYALVIFNANAIGPRLAIGAIVAAQLLFLLAPPLLSQDVFSYIAYARLDVVHSLNPYTHSPSDVPTDAVYGFAGSKDATSAYGPLFTIASLPMAKLGVSTAFWTLKLIAAAATLGIVALTWRCAELLDRNPVPAALFVALNPLVLVHVVAGAHNDALMMVFVMGGVLALLADRPALAGALESIAVGVKASAGLVAPFMLAGTRRWGRLIAGAVLAAAAVLAASLIAFGGKALDALILIGQNQEKTSQWSIPQRIADGVAALTGGDADSIVHFTRALALAAFLVVLALLLRDAWRKREQRGYWIGAAGWATLALLLATAWLVPWYAIWLLPLAALSADRRLALAALALSAYMMVIAVPL